MILNVNSLGQKFIHFNTVMMGIVFDVFMTHQSNNTFIIGFSELIGMLIGLYLILYTRRKWIWVGILNAIAGLCTYTVWLIPPTSNIKKSIYKSDINMIFVTVNDTHQTGLAMIACIALKITVSSAMSVLTACTADLVAPEKKKILMLSAGIWGRSWILWAPFVGVLGTYGSLVPVSVMAMLTVIGGILCSMIGLSQTNNLKNHIKNTNVCLVLNKGNCGVKYFITDLLNISICLENCILLESKS